MTHIISLLVENQQGVLARISGLFSGRGYNLESITAGVTTDPTVQASVMRVTVGSAVTPAVMLSRLYPRPEKSPEIRASTPCWFSTCREMICVIRSSPQAFIISWMPAPAGTMGHTFASRQCGSRGRPAGR